MIRTGPNDDTWSPAREDRTLHAESVNIQSGYIHVVASEARA